MAQVQTFEPSFWPNSNSQSLKFIHLFDTFHDLCKKHIDGAKKIETGTCAIYNWPGFDTLEAPNLETGRPRAIYSVPLFHIDRFTGISRRVVPSTLPLSQLYLRHLLWQWSICMFCMNIVFQTRFLISGCEVQKFQGGKLTSFFKMLWCHMEWIISGSF